MDNRRIEELILKLQDVLGTSRYVHTMGVMYTAASLAMRYDADLESAMLAGLLHDCAKGIPNKKKIELCLEYGLEVSETEAQNPSLLHAKLGAYLAENKYSVSDREILSAIKYHTTGRPDMSLLEKIVYIADYIEPHRCEAPHLDTIRMLAFSDIDQCLLRILEDSLKYLNQQGAVIDSMTEKTYQYYNQTQEV